MKKRLALPIFLLSLWLEPRTLWAQSPSPIDGRIEIAVGVDWRGPVTFSTADAIEWDRDGESYRLFSTHGEMGSIVAYRARLSVRASDAFEVEAGVSYASPDLIVRVDEDVEDADSIDVVETVKQIRVEGGFLANLRGSGRSIPFLVAGAGYSRELHEGQTLAVAGQEYFVGGGLKRVLRSSPGSRLDVVGLRLDARVVVRLKGVALDDRAHVLPVVGASLFLRF